MILVAGSANLDFVVNATHIPAPGETVLGREFRTFPGGKGANQAVAVARAGGVATHMLLALGMDAFAAPIEASLLQAGVVLHPQRLPDVATGTAFICVSDDAENAITVAPGANAFLQGQHLQSADIPPLADFSHLLLQLETPLEAVTAFAQAAQQAGVQVVLNAAPAQRLPTGLLANVDVLVVNAGELAIVAGGLKDSMQPLRTIDQQLTQLAMAFPRCTVVVTLGAHGCCAQTAGSAMRVFQPAFAITPVDTTAAGDTFCGALAAALSQKAPFSEALRQASAAAALACTRAGAQASIPSLAEVQAFLNRQPLPSADFEAIAAVQRFIGLT